MATISLPTVWRRRQPFVQQPQASGFGNENGLGPPKKPLRINTLIASIEVKSKVLAVLVALFGRRAIVAGLRALSVPGGHEARMV
ncbi:MAG: hypothetical protein N2483_09400 [Burkholderiaceae bacterium]|nr:hypothetical protein [Burkholderiaceae bacterium]